MSTNRRAEDVRHHFDKELEGVRREAVTIGSLVLENARRAAEAMLENDLALADEVIAADREVDERSAALERRIFEVMARQQPVASDLRLLVAITRLVYELERTGDLVTNCVKALKYNEGFDLTPRTHGLLDQAARASSDVLAKGLDSLSDLDAELGATLEREDDVVDNLVDEFYTTLPRESEAHGLETAISLSRVGRYLERIADHGVNIGQHVHYIVTGEFPAGHKSAD